MDYVQELSSNLDFEVEDEFALLSSKEKIIYSLKNMKELEDTFQKVCPS